jgi:hypothetical protein
LLPDSRHGLINRPHCYQPLFIPPAFSASPGG